MSRRYFWFDDITEENSGQLPESIPAVVLTGTYMGPHGLPCSGKVEIEAPSALSYPDEDVIVNGPAVIRLDGSGSFSIRIPATDSTSNPVDWAYTVTERLDGFIDRPPYAIKLPAELGTADLADLAPTDPETPNYVPVVGPPGPRGPRGSTGSEGPQGPQGDAGTPGAHWTFGEGAPAHEAADGDLYADTLTGDLYVHDGGSWAQRSNVRGPQGEPGRDGTGAGTVVSVNGHVGADEPDITLRAADFPDLGQANGFASLGQDGLVPAGQLPRVEEGVRSVNGVKADENGNVPLTAEDLDALPVSAVGSQVPSLEEGRLPMSQMPGSPVSVEISTNVDRIKGRLTYQQISPGVVFFTLSVDATADPTDGEPSGLDLSLPFTVGGSSQGFVTGVWSRGSDTPNRTMIYAEPSPTNKTLVLWQQNDGTQNGDWNRFGTSRIAKGHHVTVSGTLFTPSLG